LDIKGGIEAPHKSRSTTSIATSNTRTQDVVLLSSGRLKPI
jgi:hypothetical protein